MNPVMTESMKAVSDICDTIIKKVDRAYVLEASKRRERPEKLWRLWADTGLLAIGLPEEYGGVGGKMSEVVLAHDRLHSAGLFLPLTIPNYMVRFPMLKHGTEEQKRKYLPGTATGETFFAFCITEADSGTNTFKIRTNAKRQANGDFVLNGQKCYITGFDEAENAIVVARTQPHDPNNHTSGLSLFIVPTKSKGISTTLMDLAVYMPDRNFIVNFDDVVVPAENMLGEEGHGLECMFDCLNPERLLAGGMNLGLAEYALMRGVEYAKIRAPFDVPIGSYQSVAHPLAIAKIRIDTARLMLYNAAERYDAGEKIGLQANMIKWLTSDALTQAANIAATVHGGAFADIGTDLIPFYLQAKMSEMAPINNSIILSFVAQKGLGLPKSY
ncbi:acyl-CoA dehydrogenase family protein [Hydrogenophaga sp.]|uniref:acyl-CoA dehydrogenase family protein n=1 Tax=Hydrogenophaga sp. TaxID=1904254 RepID=UPI00271BF923|nr:acyl-CoA dehydrogenase family protein [Hydrogenophaga sp.]MDO9439060.1 acyl-CoA dehydrogenase family protein [Hydrogenophaga sp.]